MDQPIKNLPPSKRFNLLHHHHHHQSTTVLPAKKRVWAPPPPSPTKPTIPNKEDEEAILPAKKRAWVPPPPSPLKPTNHNKDKDDDGAAAAAVLPAKKRALPPPPPPSPPKPANPENQEVDVTHDDDDDDDGITCAVCRSTDADPTDPIVFCDGCDLTVHSTCYGSPLLHSIPDGPWFCLQCSESPKPPNSKCCLCPKQGGPLKPTVDGQWAHIICALLVPEVFFRDPEGREGIDCSEVPLMRRNVECYVCGGRGGCGVECSERKCGLGFHASCGVEEGLCFEVREGKGGDGGIVAGFCGEHTKLWKKVNQLLLLLL